MIVAKGFVARARWSLTDVLMGPATEPPPVNCTCAVFKMVIRSWSNRGALRRSPFKKISSVTAVPLTVLLPRAALFPLRRAVHRMPMPYRFVNPMRIAPSMPRRALDVGLVWPRVPMLQRCSLSPRRFPISVNYPKVSPNVIPVP